MKNISLVFNVVLAIAVAVLFYLHFSSGKKNGGTSTTDTNADVTPGSVKVLYINTDSINSGYAMTKMLEEKFIADNTVRQQKLQAKQSSFQRQMKDYEAKVMTMTQRERGIKEEELGRLQQDFMAEQQELSQLAAMQEQQMMLQIYDTLGAFFKGYAVQKGADMVFSYQKGSDIMFINPKYDVTGEALKLLNERHEKYGKTEPTEAPVK